MAFDLGFDRAGMRCVWQVENDAKARSVLARHWPDVPRFEDVRDVGAHNLSAIDVICGGFPCQDLSVAGKRAGFGGERSSLFFEMVRITNELQPAFLVWENVPGLLSARNGRDFAAVLMALAGIGYHGAWTGLDARYFGLAQRRRRIFGVFARADIGAGRCAEILSLAHRLRWHPAPGGKTREGVAGTAIKGAAIGRKPEAGPQYGEVLTDGSMYTLNATEVHADGVNLGFASEPQTFDWQAGVASANDRTEIMDKPGRTRSLSSSRTLAVFGLVGHGEYSETPQPLRSQHGDAGGGSENLVVAAEGGNNTAGEIDIATAVNAKGGTGRMDFESETFVFEPRYARNGRGAPDTIAPPLKAENEQTGKGDGAPVVAYSLTTEQTPKYAADLAMTLTKQSPTGGGQPQAVAWHGAPTVFTQNQRDEVRDLNDLAGALPAKPEMKQQNYVALSGVRRLTPKEAERLQGFPDGHTAEGADGPQSDSARYRQLGNAVAVPVAEWIGRRIVEVTGS